MARPRVQLPDCSSVGDTHFALTAAEKQELVKRIAEGGPDAIDAFIEEKRAAGDPLIAHKIRRIKEELLKRAEALKARLAGDHEARAAELEQQYGDAFAELDYKQREMHERLTRLKAGDADFFDEALAGSDVVNLVLSAPTAKPSAWVRFKRVLRKVIAFILWPVRWLLNLLFPAKKKPHDKRITMSAPVPGRYGTEVESRVGDAFLSNPDFRRRVKGRLRAAPPREKVRRAWERLLGREDYESIARAVAREMMQEDAEKTRREREQSFTSELARLQEEEESRRAEREQAVKDLEDAREKEAQRIEQELAEAPERELKDVIMDELKGTGLIREQDGKILPTLQFMDSFAAMAYAEESRALGGSRGGSAGEYAEGDGTFTREPLRSAVETSHMDVVATLVNARTRHPNVRHVTDDDVLVYREEREALQHVVIILDASGSMEENNRMDAAKKAALALMHAVKQEHPRNRVDFVEMNTSVRRVDAVGVWGSEPSGFTNTGGALRLAKDLIRDARSERGLVYLVTDGLPEAYTVDGEDVAGHPEKARAFAVDQARALKQQPGFGGFVTLLLEPEDEMFVTAAEALSGELDGKVVKLTPDELGKELIREYWAS